jgi:hypothetical protein
LHFPKFLYCGTPSACAVLIESSTVVVAINPTPAVKILLMSAFEINSNELSAGLAEIKIEGFIQKPISLYELNNGPKTIGNKDAVIIQQFIHQQTIRRLIIIVYLFIIVFPVV